MNPNSYIIKKLLSALEPHDELVELPDTNQISNKDLLGLPVVKILKWLTKAHRKALKRRDRMW